MLDQPKNRLIWSKMPRYWYIARGLFHFFCIFPFLYMYILRFLKNLWWTSNFNFATLSIKVCIIWTSCDWVILSLVVVFQNDWGTSLKNRSTYFLDTNVGSSSSHWLSPFRRKSLKGTINCDPHSHIVWARPLRVPVDRAGYSGEESQLPGCLS